MKDENKCDSPMGGFYNDCEITRKDGSYVTGTGKARYLVTYYLKDDEEKTEHTYKMCKDCAGEYMIKEDCPEAFNEQVIRIEKIN